MPTLTGSSEGPRRVHRRRLIGSVLALLLMAGAAAGTLLGVRSLGATAAPSIALSPARNAEVYYRPTPLTFTVNASNFAGPGQTPVAAYQYSITWDPTKLQWLSGPSFVPGPGTPVPIPCSPNPYYITWGTATATPIGWSATWTPTPTSTATPGGPPTNTPTNTATATYTPTPGGYILLACASLPGTSTTPTGLIGSFTFLPLVISPQDVPITLGNVQFLNSGNATETPAPISGTASGGVASFVICTDIDGDLSIDGIDLVLLAGAFGSAAPSSAYLPAADFNHDGSIDAVDLTLFAASFGLNC